MLLQILKSKIHRARVTEANLNYIGSITIDEDLADAAGLFSNENMALTWKKYQKKYSYASDISWEQIGASIRKLWKSID